MSLKCDSWVFSVVTHVTLKGVEGRGNDRAPEHPIPPGTLGAAALARTDASSRPWSRSPSGTDTVQWKSVLGYTQTLQVRRQGEAKLVILARARGHAAKPGAHHRSGNMTELGAAGGASSRGHG
ncbi:hypothetical protein QTO34_008564 [Cnephaeus nilssonii]|uniref:Uncharacterized protein n=1 Tax=Cnephaeus nilssonii TaxID=3371016 RepID=A0AA40LU71_CNENI|nr:hypothetical protein QTO34_008564 [Eptesicus nilssonii]